MASSPWIPIPNNNFPDGWPPVEHVVWIRMRDWDRRPVRVGVFLDADGNLEFDIIKNDDEYTGYRVKWPDVDAWHQE